MNGPWNQVCGGEAKRASLSLDLEHESSWRVLLMGIKLASTSGSLIETPQGYIESRAHKPEKKPGQWQSKSL